MAKEGITSMKWAQEVQKPGARTLGKLEKPEGQSDWSTEECVSWGLSFYSEPRVKSSGKGTKLLRYISCP